MRKQGVFRSHPPPKKRPPARGAPRRAGEGRVVATSGRTQESWRFVGIVTESRLLVPVEFSLNDATSLMAYIDLLRHAMEHKDSDLRRMLRNRPCWHETGREQRVVSKLPKRAVEKVKKPQANRALTKRRPVRPVRRRGCGALRTRATDLPPGRTPTRSERAVVEGGGDSAQGLAAVAQPLDLGQELLLGRIRLDVLPVAGHPETRGDVTEPFALAALVVQGVACAFADRLPLPL